jgi:hypothetical protein
MRVLFVRETKFRFQIRLKQILFGTSFESHHQLLVNIELSRLALLIDFVDLFLNMNLI